MPNILCLRPEADFTRIGVIPPSGLDIIYMAPDDPDMPGVLKNCSALVIPAVGPNLPLALFDDTQLKLVQVTGAGVDRVDESAVLLGAERLHEVGDLILLLIADARVGLRNELDQAHQRQLLVVIQFTNFHGLSSPGSGRRGRRRPMRDHATGRATDMRLRISFWSGAACVHPGARPGPAPTARDRTTTSGEVRRSSSIARDRGRC